MRGYSPPAVVHGHSNTSLGRGFWLAYGDSLRVHASLARASSVPVSVIPSGLVFERPQRHCSLKAVSSRLHGPASGAVGPGQQTPQKKRSPVATMP